MGVWFVVAIVSVWCVCVRPQCVNETYATQYQNADVPCDTVVGSLQTKCKNFLVCRLSNSNLTDDTHTCVYSSEKIYADFPYGQSCVTDSDCVTPQYCSSSICDYRNLPNGYSCERDSQCSSLHCHHSDDQDDWGECDVSGDADVDSEGFVKCGMDADCDAEFFCSVEGECLPSLAQGDICTLYNSSIGSASYVCGPGLACLPVSSNQSKCTPLYKGARNTYCGGLAYVCGTNLFCNATTLLCEYYPTYDGKAQACSSDVEGLCPEGFECSCAGNVNQTDTAVCTKFFNSFCSTALTNYMYCLQSSKCPFDPYTVVGNPLSAYPSTFVGPLNRFSCAATQCTQKYNDLVKCQNDGFKYDDHFSPAYIPMWSEVDDASLKGWQLALIVVGALTGAVAVAAAIVLVRGKSTYEDI